MAKMTATSSNIVSLEKPRGPARSRGASSGDREASRGYAAAASLAAKPRPDSAALRTVPSPSCNASTQYGRQPRASCPVISDGKWRYAPSWAPQGHQSAATDRACHGSGGVARRRESRNGVIAHHITLRRHSGSVSAARVSVRCRDGNGRANAVHDIARPAAAVIVADHGAVASQPPSAFRPFRHARVLLVPVAGHVGQPPWRLRSALPDALPDRAAGHGAGLGGPARVGARCRIISSRSSPVASCQIVSAGAR